jgi:hypothetical protein
MDPAVDQICRAMNAQCAFHSKDCLRKISVMIICLRAFQIPSGNRAQYFRPSRGRLKTLIQSGGGIRIWGGRWGRGSGGCLVVVVDACRRLGMKGVNDLSVSGGRNDSARRRKT